MYITQDVVGTMDCDSGFQTQYQNFQVREYTIRSGLNVRNYFQDPEQQEARECSGLPRTTWEHLLPTT